MGFILQGCGKQYVGSATDFKERLTIHKSDINNGKVKCGVTNHLLNVCSPSASKFEFLKVQLIEKVSVQNGEKYWKAQLSTLSHGLNNPHE